MSQNGPKFEWRGSDTGKSGMAIYSIGSEEYHLTMPSCAAAHSLHNLMLRIYAAGIRDDRELMRRQINYLFEDQK